MSVPCSVTSEGSRLQHMYVQSMRGSALPMGRRTVECLGDSMGGCGLHMLADQARCVLAKVLGDPMRLAEYLVRAAGAVSGGTVEPVTGMLNPAIQGRADDSGGLTAQAVGSWCGSEVDEFLSGQRGAVFGGKAFGFPGDGDGVDRLTPPCHGLDGPPGRGVAR